MSNIKRKLKIEGDLDIFVVENEDELDSEMSSWKEVLIHGDPIGLKSFASLLIEIANTNQENISDEELPDGEREHIKLKPGIELSKSSDEVIVGRLDAKKTGAYYKRFVSK